MFRGRGADRNKPSYRDEVKGRLNRVSTCPSIKTVLWRAKSLDLHFKLLTSLALEKVHHNYSDVKEETS